MTVNQLCKQCYLDTFCVLRQSFCGNFKLSAEFYDRKYGLPGNGSGALELDALSGQIQDVVFIQFVVRGSQTRVGGGYICCNHLSPTQHNSQLLNLSTSPNHRVGSIKQFLEWASAHSPQSKTKPNQTTSQRHLPRGTRVKPICGSSPRSNCFFFDAYLNLNLKTYPNPIRVP